MRLIRPLFISALLMLGALAASATTPGVIVARFFPPALTTDGDQAIPPDDLQSSYVLGDLDGSGSQEIVAVYCNGLRGSVAILSPNGDGALVAQNIPSAMTGQHADVQLIDLAHDGHPAIVVTMEQGRGLPITWIFRFSGASLTPIGPFADDDTSDDVASDLADPTFLDIGTGALAVVDHHAGRWCDDDGTPHANAAYRLFQYTNGAFQSAGTLDYFRKFTRGTGAPSSQTDSFTVSNATAPRQMVIVNGERDGSARVTSAHIKLNGQAVVGPDAFNEQVGVVRASVALGSSNTLSVELAGKPGSSIRILFLPAPQ